MKNDDDLILQVKNLRTSFFTQKGEIKAVDDISFDVYSGQTICIVGESGCGKSVTGLSLMRLISGQSGKIVGGQILYKGLDLLKLNSNEMRKIRGSEISMIFQDPMTSLNPVLTIGNQLIEAILIHQKITYQEARDQAVEMLRSVGIPSAETRLLDYSHQLSGGMRQRVMIAMALACRPKILIADEPTTALDVTIQAQILELLKRLQEKMGLALILVTHDLGVVAEVADEVIVMYAGQVVEQGQVEDIFDSPKMPYTQALLKSIPVLGSDSTGRLRKQRLETIPGIVPHFLSLPHGCRFQDRCSYVMDSCREAVPELRKVPPIEKVSSDRFDDHRIRCVRDL